MVQQPHLPVICVRSHLLYIRACVSYGGAFYNAGDAVRMHVDMWMLLCAMAGIASVVGNGNRWLSAENKGCVPVRVGA